MFNYFRATENAFLCCFFATAFFMCLLATAAQAQIDSQLREEGWLEFTFEDKKQNNFKQTNQGTIEIHTDKSVSIAYLPYREGAIDLSRTPHLEFEWQFEGQLARTDVSKKGGDDRMLAIYLAFPYQAEHASLKEKLMRPLVVAAKGRDAPGRILTYLWADEPRAGAWFENPYTGKAGYMQVIQNLDRAQTDQKLWYQHKVNIVEDFKDRFGYFPPMPSYIAIGVDSDDTMTRFIGRVRGLGFTN